MCEEIIKKKIQISFSWNPNLYLIQLLNKQYQCQLASTLMNFDNLILNDLMTGLYRFILFLFILLFWTWMFQNPA